MVENITLTTPYVITDDPQTQYIKFRNGMLHRESGVLWGTTQS